MPPLAPQALITGCSTSARGAYCRLQRRGRLLQVAAPQALIAGCSARAAITAWCWDGVCVGAPVETQHCMAVTRMQALLTFYDLAEKKFF